MKQQYKTEYEMRREKSEWKLSSVSRDCTQLFCLLHVEDFTLFLFPSWLALLICCCLHSLLVLLFSSPWFFCWRLGSLKCRFQRQRKTNSILDRRENWTWEMAVPGFLRIKDQSDQDQGSRIRIKDQAEFVTKLNKRDGWLPLHCMIYSVRFTQVTCNISKHNWGVCFYLGESQIWSWIGSKIRSLIRYHTKDHLVILLMLMKIDDYHEHHWWCWLQGLLPWFEWRLERNNESLFYHIT